MKRFLQLLTVLTSVIVPLLLASCATKTDPSFLQSASAALFGVTGGIASRDGAMMAPVQSQRQSGFNDFFGGAR